ncbi:MAG: hypothetical protein CO141_00785 [Candidatus Moranbacteria bacterium CG_4_9_14_3_um_filter_42_9]|nr:MAG: hypothetical protein CO141_00785 [Candidatus Moranbacteria bacterium CG_4_9_14_3_um_filter_42_9]
MKKSSLNKISKILLLFLTIAIIGSFCFQIVSANQDPAMAGQGSSHTKSTSSDVMPCCQENSGHLLAISDLPSTKYPLQILSLILAIIPVICIILESKFSKYSFSFSSLAPLGPDLMLAVVKRE